LGVIILGLVIIGFRRTAGLAARGRSFPVRGNALSTHTGTFSLWRSRFLRIFIRYGSTSTPGGFTFWWRFFINRLRVASVAPPPPWGGLFIFSVAAGGAAACRCLTVIILVNADVTAIRLSDLLIAVVLQTIRNRIVLNIGQPFLLQLLILAKG
jgi:hypothetical protein